MNLKEELGMLCGGAVEVLAGDPLDIPCIETSDPEKLCKHPVVSVHMITYNHEPYIRQAIEGVMMQKTDFEFELVIGEDCSTDKTREICFEYQAKFPDKVRVLWWNKNLGGIGANGKRVEARCRGAYIAFCEGDDFWIDEYKLQRQYDLVKKTKSVGCVAFNRIMDCDGHEENSVWSPKATINSSDYLKHYFHTSTYFFHKETLVKMKSKFSRILQWYDTVVFHCMADMGDIALLPEIVSTRRITGRGVATSLSDQRRVVLGLKQLIPLYLYGPQKWHNNFGERILDMTCHYFYRHTLRFSHEDFVKYKGVVQRVFFKSFLRFIWSLCAWMALARFIKYRTESWFVDIVSFISARRSR